MKEKPAAHASANRDPTRRTVAGMSRLIAVRPGERTAFFWSFSYFFALLCSYYIVRPMRDEMGIAGGVEHLQWMFSATFVVMLAAVPVFGWVTRRFAVGRFLPYVYLFFIAHLLMFFILFKSNTAGTYVARAFFIWASVFNLFIVSVFWSLMADIFDADQARRLFGMIAAGGTLGALTGPALTAALVIQLGPTNLLLLSAAFLGWAVVCIHRLIAWRASTVTVRPGKLAPEADIALGGSIVAGVQLIVRSPYLIGICLLMLFFTTLATFLYFQQAHIVRLNFDDPARRTALFAGMDFTVNALTLFLQVLLTGRIVGRFGLGWTLALIPLLLTLGFLVLGFSPVLGVLVVIQVLRRAGMQQMERSRQRMAVPAIDLMQIHNLRDWQTHLPVLREWKQAGKIRYIGITTSHGRSHNALEQIMLKEPLDFVQFSYSLADRTVEKRLLPLAADRGIATLINRPFQRGSLFRKVSGIALPPWSAEVNCNSWGQFFLKYILSHPAVTCVIPATSKPHHMLDNMGAGFGWLPDTRQRSRMEKYFNSL